MTETEPRTLQDLVRALAAGGDVPFIYAVAGDDVSTRSRAEVGGDALRLARGLVADGLQGGEPVAAVGPNSMSLCIVRLALSAAGALAVPIDDLADADEVAAYIRDSGARRVFTSRAHLDAVREALAEGQADIRVLDGEDGENDWRNLQSESEGDLPELSPDDPTVLVYTSGTTGAPKGFTLSHANLLHNVNVLCEERLIGPDDRALMPLPLHHAYPFTVGLLLVARCGAAVVFPEAVRGPEIIRALKLSRATAMVGVPRLYKALVQGLEARVAGRGLIVRTIFRALLGISKLVRRLTGWRIGRKLLAPVHRELAPSLRLMASGGAKLEAGLAETLEGFGWACYSGYGLAETASIFTGNRPGHHRLGSEGRPLPGGELRINEPDETGTGEIQLRGPNVFDGYRDNAEANRQAFTEDGWFRTGDLGHVDDEGYLFVTGRIKELIVLGGGKNVFPDEIEGHLAEASCVKEVAVFEDDGALRALVVPDLDAIARAGARRVEDEVRVALAEKARGLASYKRPSGFAITREALPRTRLGKVRRHLVPDLYKAARAGRGGSAGKAAPTKLSPEDETLVARPPARDVWQWLREKYGDQGVTPDTSPELDLGIDSIEWINLSLELERRFDVHLSEDQITEIMTVRDLLEAVAEGGSGKDAPREKALSAEQLEARYLRPARWWERALGYALFGINLALCRLMFRVETSGLENLPSKAPYIIVANHVSDLDPPVLGAALPLGVLRRAWWSGAAERVFTGPVKRALARSVNLFPVEERAPERTLALAAAVLVRGACLVWFPESWRSPDGTLQRFLPGIGAVVQRKRVPCVPVFISGTFEAMPRGAVLPRPRKVRVAVGPVLAAETLLASENGGEAGAQAVADRLRDAVAGLEKGAGKP